MLKWIEINLKTIKENAAIIKNALAPGVNFIAVVKANGYGHGMRQAAMAAISGGADSLAVLTEEEGVLLRASFPNLPIHLLAPSLPEQAQAIIANKLIPTSDNYAFLARLSQSAKFSKITANWTLEVDMGMRRWGVLAKEAIEFLKAAMKLPNLKLYALSSHIGYKPPQNMTDAKEKLRLFSSLAKKASAIAGFKVKAFAANSSVFCDIAESHLDGVRIGNLLYGIYPTDIYKSRRNGPPLPGLKRPWQFYARIISVKDIKKGQKSGYNSEFTALRDMRLGAIPAGYSDGLTMEPTLYQIRLSAGFRYWGIIEGRRAYFTGRPGISHTLLDISNIPNAHIGTPVALHIRRTAANLQIPKIYI